ncbi:hypothetical protein R5R35_011248 [Gryllus longicercus]|uniref:Odorant binding protein n=1 Tax=Gryllus longicercus TaxID=2509291 RepID=A0AAN9VVY6_9ORTH
MTQCGFIFIHLLFALALGWAQTSEEAPVSGYRKCQMKYPHANESEIVRDGELNPDVTNETKCFLHCILENEGFMSENTVNKTAVISVFDTPENEYRNEMISAANSCCEETDPADCCNTAVMISICMEKALEKIRKSRNERNQ